MSAKILIVDDDSLNRQIVSRVLTKAGYEMDSAKDGPEALAMIESAIPDLVVLDVMMPGMSGFEVCRQLRQDPKTAPLLVILLTASTAVESRIEGFEAGADDFLAKPFHPAELVAHVQALLRRLPQMTASEPAPLTKGKTVAFFSLRGGVGVSTLSTNVAVALAQLWQYPVALVDLALTCGQSAMMLNQPLRNTWGDLASIPLEDVTEDLVTQVLLRHESDVSVLAAPPSCEISELITAPTVDCVLDHLAAKFPYVVIDLPHDFRETTLVGLEKADQIVLVFAPEISSIYAAKRTLDTLALLEYPVDQVTLMLNWTFERRGLARKGIESALRRPVDYLMPYAESMLVEALNLGKPSVLHHAGKPVAALFEDLAYYLSKPEDCDLKPGSPSPMWKRVATRRERRTGG
jgi:pilus assembly protein CpaE